MFYLLKKNQYPNKVLGYQVNTQSKFSPLYILKNEKIHVNCQMTIFLKSFYKGRMVSHEFPKQTFQKLWFKATRISTFNNLSFPLLTKIKRVQVQAWPHFVICVILSMNENLPHFQIKAAIFLQLCMCSLVLYCICFIFLI